MQLQPRSYTIDTDAPASRKPASVGRQALRRQVNERAAAASRTRGAATVGILCECGLAGCGSRFEVGVELYERTRLVPTHFLIAVGHDADEERVVSSYPAFAVVEKFGRSGLAAVRFDRRRRGAEA